MRSGSGVVRRPGDPGSNANRVPPGACATFATTMPVLRTTIRRDPEWFADPALARVMTRVIVDCVTGNDNYPNPTPSIASLAAQQTQREPATRQLARTDYRRPNTQLVVTAEVYDMGSSLGAFGQFSMMLGDG